MVDGYEQEEWRGKDFLTYYQSKSGIPILCMVRARIRRHCLTDIQYNIILIFT